MRRKEEAGNEKRSREAEFFSVQATQEADRKDNEQT